MKLNLRPRTFTALSWKSLFLLTLLASVVYVLMDWLFIVTKPSFMDTLSIWKKLEVLVLSSFLLAGLFGLPALLLPAIRKLLGGQPAYAYLTHGLAILPAALGASTLLLMLDNFTYTLFKWGIVSTTGVTQGFYLLLFLAMVIYSGQNMRRWACQWERIQNDRAINRLALASAGLILLSYAATFWMGSPESIGLKVLPDGQRTTSPNILLITSDGVSAEHLSVYGYERETTPRLKALAQDTLFAENAFSNAGNTAGSVTSLLTGKYPATTRVLYPPDILRGTDAYQHLPGIFRSLNYHTLQLSHPHYVDAFTLNFQESFEVANGRAASSGMFMGAVSRWMPYEVRYFLWETGGRILARLRHIFFIQKMKNPYDLVTQPPNALEDQAKVAQLLEILKTTDRPLFIHLHLMVTHGPTFYPREQVFSKGQNMEEQDFWDLDFYQDSILEFDSYVGEIVDALVENGQYDNTILVIGSDHGRAYNQMRRIPMLIHFPGNAYAGRIRANVQNLDLAPTLLDYLGIAKPAWMAGQSLLRGEIEQRPVIGVAVDGSLVGPDENDDWWVDLERSKPPFYQFGMVSLIYCQRLYGLNLTTRSWEERDIRGYAGGCPEEEIISRSDAFQGMIDHLQRNGFDTSSLVEKEILR